MNAVIQILVLILSATLHEVAHGYVAYGLGDPTAKYAGRLTLNPIAHLDLFGSFILPLVLYILSMGSFVYGYAKPVPYNPYNLKAGKWGPAIVAVSGPGTNLLLAFVFGMIVRFGYNTLPTPFLAVSTLVVIINCFLAVFNLIPIPPLDGSKVLFTLFPRVAEPMTLFFARFQLVILVAIVIFGWKIVAIPSSLLFSLFTGIHL